MTLAFGMEADLKRNVRQSRQVFCQSPSLLVYLSFLSRLFLFFYLESVTPAPFMSATYPDLASLASPLRTAYIPAGTYEPSPISDGIRPDLTI